VLQPVQFLLFDVLVMNSDKTPAALKSPPRPAPLDRMYRFVDFAAHYQKGFRNHIVPIGDVPGLVQGFKSYGCYASYFFFSDELLTYMSAQSGTPTVSGYEGKVWAPYLPIDLDHAELTPALVAARQLSDYFVDRWQIDLNGLQIYFSGLKGFHLLLDSRIFGRLAPARGLPALLDALRRHLAQEIAEPLRATIDLSIKDRMRLLRLPNTIHEKSKLFKILLSREELRGFDASQIRELAKKPRPLHATDETGFVPRLQIKQNDAAVQLFQRIQHQMKKLTRQPFVYKFHRPDDLSQLQFPCAGAQAIWENHIEAGQRNNCAIRLASEFRLLGLSADETAQKLLEWNEHNGIELSVDELRSVVRSAYQHRFPYRYSCRDDILRRFCPMRDDESCRKFVASRATPQRRTEPSL
jgi:hypothetical protein